MVAAVAALTLQGQNTNLAVTGISAAIASIITPTQQAVEMAKKLGLEFNLAALESKGFGGFLEDVVAKTNGSKEALAVLFGSMEASRAVFALAGEGGKAFNNIMEQMANRAGATDQAFVKMSKTADFELNRLVAAISDKMISAGDAMLNFIGPAAAALADNLDAVAEAGTALAVVIGTVIVARAGSALLTWLGSTVAAWYANTIEVIRYQAALARMAGITATAAAAQTALAVSTGALNAAMTALGGPIGLAIIAVTALGYAWMKASADQAEALAKQNEGIAQLEAYVESLRKAREERELLSRAEASGNEAEVQSALERRASAIAELAELESRLADAMTRNMQMQGAYRQTVLQLEEQQRNLNDAIQRADNAFQEYGAELLKSGTAMDYFAQAMGPLKDTALVQNITNLVNAFRGVAPAAAEAKTGAEGASTAASDYAASLVEATNALQMQLIELTNGRQAALEFDAMTKLGISSTSKLSAEMRKQITAIVALEARVKSITKAHEAEEQAIKDREAVIAKWMKQYRETQRLSREAFKSAIEMVEAIEEEAAQVGLTQQQIQRLNDEKAIGLVIDKAAKSQSAAAIADLKKRADAALDARDAAQKLNDEQELANRLIEQFGQNSQFDYLIDNIKKVEQALREATDPEIVAGLKASLGNLRQELAVSMVGAAQQMLGSIQSMSKEGSKAYKAMEIASAALNVVMAIGAILNQGKGDPYTAPARMAAMAALVSSIAGLAGAIGGFGGGGPSGDSAEARQQLQGTGSILGDSEAQSESIVNAIEITANATSELVGINRGMLRALLVMQNGIGNAAAGLSQTGFESIDLKRAFEGWGGPLGGVGRALLRSVFGGSQSLIDQGLLIGGGNFGNVSSNPRASTYQTIETDGGWFGSDRTNDRLRALSQSATNQIRLVLESMGDAVRQGAIALGLDAEEINAAIEAFRIEEIRISTMDLTGEEAQRQLEAVFSQIFDGLAGSVVPFIGQFQRVGEGLGETLVRVATGVQVTQEALLRLGFTLETTGPEQFAQISESLIELIGGIDEFIQGMNSFVNAFAPDSHKFAMLQSDLTRALDQVGLAVPDTRDAMWELMQSLDATTESGREQIAALLRLSTVADAYYEHLENRASQLADFMAEIDDAMAPVVEDGLPYWVDAMEDLVAENDALIARAIALGASEAELARIRAYAQRRVDDLRSAEQQSLAELAQAHATAAAELDQLITTLAQGEWGSPIQSLIDLDAQYREHIATIQRLAQESGRAEASQAELLMATRWYQRQLQKLAGEIMQSALSLLGQLGYEGYQTDPTQTELGGIDQVNNAVEDRYARELQLLQQLDEFVRGLNLSNISPLTPGQRLADAQSEYERLLALAQGGDLDALAQLQDAANAYLQEAHDYFGGVGDFPAIFASVRDALAALVSAGPQSTPMGPTTPVIGGPVIVNPGDGFAAMNASERALLTQQLVDHLAALSLALNTPILQLIDDMGIPLTQLATDLGADLSALTGESVRVISALAHDLGLPLGQMVQELGLNLPDLANGIRELAGDLDINLNALTAETAMQLAGLAGSLSTDLTVLTQSLGIDLGRLTDINSPIFQALQQTIDTLSPDIRAQLAPLLSGITGAVSDADATAAVEATEAAINAMPVGIRDLLAPFFDNVFPAGALTELSYLGSIDLAMFSLNGTASRSETALLAILQNIQAQNSAMELPTYEQGTPFVPVTGPAMLHAGEMVVPRAIAERIRNGEGMDPGSDGIGHGELVAEVRELRRVIDTKLSSISENTRVVAADVQNPKPMARGVR